VRGQDAAQQLSSIAKAQRKSRDRGSHKIIESIRKSEQRLQNELDKIQSLDDAYEQFG
jgi:hypothetical protein